MFVAIVTGKYKGRLAAVVSGTPQMLTVFNPSIGRVRINRSSLVPVTGNPFQD